MRVGLVYNPEAGSGKGGSLWRKAERALNRRGVDVVACGTTAPRDAERLARAFVMDVDAVVAVGGDGTVNEVANGLAGSGVPLGIVPGGTANVLALELDIPRDVDRASDIIAAGYARAIDLGTAGDRYFTLMAGAGLDALTIRELDPRRKRRFHKVAFALTGLRAHLGHPTPPFPVRVDGERHEATFLVAGNCRYYGGRFGVAIDADPTDGLLDVVLFRGAGTATTAAFWVSTLLRQQARHPQVTYLRARQVALDAPPPDGAVWWQTDGELGGRLPLAVGVAPLALRVLVPEASDRRKGYAADRRQPAVNNARRQPEAPPPMPPPGA